jgi:2-dehydro-3-deoxy-D-arabinonate dehydratase
MNSTMNLCRFKDQQPQARIGLVLDHSTLVDLTPAGVLEMQPLLESDDPVAQLNQIDWQGLPRLGLAQVRLCAPLERQEVWAAGVTYLRSKTARMNESDFGATAYDRVYAADRPELFFKSLAEKVVANGEPVGIRADARWSVPEPELALVLNSRGSIVAYTIGNDMSARDIEGENLLYLPQAKIFEHSCALGPWLCLGAPESTAREWTIRLAIRRQGQAVFTGQTSVGQIKRRFDDLARFLFRSQSFPGGVVLLTGTGIVPPDAFTLQAQDLVEIEVSGIGRLENPVAVV